MIASPCINVCALDAEGLRCLGCGRTIEEIAGWGAMGEAEKARVVARLPRRRAARCPGCGATFGCGAADADHACWCASVPPVEPSIARGTCLCPACLAAAAAPARNARG